MIKALWRVCLLLLTIVLLLVLTAVFILTTTSGAKLALHVIAALSNHALSVGEVQGQLIHRVTLSDVKYADTSLEFKADTITLNWQAIALLEKHVLIDQLLVRNADIITKQTNTSKPTHFFLPLSWQIKQIQLENISYRQDNNQPIQVKDLHGHFSFNQTISVEIAAQLAQPIHIKSHITLNGTLDAYQWDIQLSAADSDWHVQGKGNQTGTTFNTLKSQLLQGNLSANGQIHWTPTPDWQLNLQATALDLASVLAQAPKNLNFNITSSGNPQAFNFNLTHLQGMWQNLPLRGTLAFQIKRNNMQPETNLLNILNNSRFTMDTDLRWGATEATLNGGLMDSWQLHYKIAAANLNNINRNLQGSISADGNITGQINAPKLNSTIIFKDITSAALSNARLNTRLTVNATASLQPDINNAALNITASQGQLDYKIGNKRVSLPWSGSLNINQKKQLWTSDLELLLYQKKFINATLRLPDHQLFNTFSIKQPFDAKLHAQLELTQLAALQSFSINNIQGHLTADITATGTVNNKQLHGAVNIINMGFAVPDLGLTIHNTNLKAAIDNQSIHYNGSLQSGSGSLSIQGKTTLQNENLLSDFSVSGKDFLASNTAKIKLYLSPDLKIAQLADGWHITGKLTIPQADIKLLDTTDTIVLPAETVVINQAGEKNTETTQGLFTDITLILGNSVHLDTSGLKSRISGTVTVHDMPTDTTRATGKINLIDGSYDLQGQTLTINNSAFIFLNSPVNNPNLNITATKTIQHVASSTSFGQNQDFVVGLRVTAKAENPVIVLFSDPPGWSQTDILSLIVFGQPASTLSNSSIGLLATAAQALGSRNGTPGVATQLTSQLQQFFGLSELGLQSSVGIETNTNQTSTSFVLGKYLSPRLYLSYSMGLDAANILRLRYLLSKHWSVQTQASTVGNGVDLLYSIGH